MMRIATTIGIGALVAGSGAAIFAVVYALSGRWGWAGVIVAIGLAWLSESWHSQRWIWTLGLIFFAAAAALGVLWRFSPFWMLTGLVVILAAWDLSRWEKLLADTPDVRNAAALTHAHLRRLGGVIGLGWGLAMLALNVEIHFGFIWSLALALLIVVGLSRVIRYMLEIGD
jgi:hypothetical protein